MTKASWVFSVNDIIANLGLIVAGILVAVTKSPHPDLLVGFAISVVVLHGAYRILKLNRRGKFLVRNSHRKESK